MSWWGKVVGGTFGFMFGGPLGALLGAVLGNYFDTGLDGTGSGDFLGRGNTERVQTAFFTATFSVMGYIAKSDGHVSRHEVELAERVMQQMRLSPRQRQVAIDLFNAGKQDGFPLLQVLDQLRQEAARRSTLLQMFLEIVIATAFADGTLDARERNLLQSIATQLGFAPRQLEQLLGRISGQAQFAQTRSSEEQLRAAYKLLGVSEEVSDADLKKAYRRQMNQHHPDKLVAKGLPDEMMDIATRKAQEIKAAYELIKSSRGGAT